MSDTPTFLELLDRLTLDGHTFILTDSGEKLRVQRPALLRVLREEVSIGLETGGSNASFGSRPTISVAAADLLDEIDKQAAEVLVAVTHRPVPYGFTEAYIRLWAGHTKEDQPFTVTVKQTIAMSAEEAHRRHIPMVFTNQEQTTAYALLKRWHDRIEDHFNPPSSREIAAPCPNCQARYSLRESGGVTVRTSALSILRDRDTGRPTEARCAVCSRSWPPDQFAFLATLVGAQPVPELVDVPVEDPASISISALPNSGQEVTAND